MITLKVNVLGTDYEIIIKDYESDPYFKKYEADGYCCSIEKQIVLCNMLSHPDFGENETYAEKYKKQVLRHEIVHAFFNESGLENNTGVINNIGWSKNEEMVDWIALQGLKLCDAWKSVGAI